MACFAYCNERSYSSVALAPKISTDQRPVVFESREFLLTFDHGPGKAAGKNCAKMNILSGSRNFAFLQENYPEY